MCPPVQRGRGGCPGRRSFRRRGGRRGRRGARPPPSRGSPAGSSRLPVSAARSCPTCPVGLWGPVPWSARRGSGRGAGRRARGRWRGVAAARRRASRTPSAVARPDPPAPAVPRRSAGSDRSCGTGRPARRPAARRADRRAAAVRRAPAAAGCGRGGGRGRAPVPGLDRDGAGPRSSRRWWSSRRRSPPGSRTSRRPRFAGSRPRRRPSAGSAWRALRRGSQDRMYSWSSR